MVYVLLDATNREQHAAQSPPNPSDGHQLIVDQSELVGEMRNQIDWLRRESERKDVIIMQMAQANASLATRVPELEPPSETRDGSETASPRSGGGAGGIDGFTFE